ncbi:MAG: phage portal protein [Clostridia bacterium]|nr:phage portal protein [Clostridia bacterium]
MYRFTYPAELWDENNLDKNIILTLVRKHEAMVGRLAKNMAYYNGHHAIELRKREDNVPNNRVVCNHARDISDTAAGYFMGNPITYSNTGDANIEPLLTAFDRAEIDDADSDLALDASIYGVAYEYVYAKEGEAIPTSKAICPENTFMILDDSIEENELAGVYYYKKKNSVNDTYVYVATVSTAHYTYVLNIIDSDSDISQLVTEVPVPHYFGEPQIIEYLNNKEGIGDFEQQIPLIDAYDTLMSDRVNDKDQFIDAVLVLYGAILGDTPEESAEAQEQLRENKLLELPEDAKAEYLTRQLDESGVEILRKAIKEDIYTFSHVPDLTDENFAGNSSGVAMEYKLLGLEMLTKTKERHYRQGIRKRIRLYCNFLALQAIQMDAGSIVATFSRALPKNLQELSQIVTNLSGQVSKRTLLKLLPFVEDPDYELKQVDKEKAEDVKRQQDLFSMGANRFPQYEDEDEEEEPAVDEDEEEDEEDQDKSKTKAKE